MREIWSEKSKFTTWRRLWVALAQAQCEVGVPGVKQSAVDALRAAAEEPIDFEFAQAAEAELRHDVMAHIRTFAQAAKISEAQAIIHLGATSAFVQDNTDLIHIRDSGEVIRGKALRLIRLLRNFAMENRSQACLAYTHLQPAQCTTVGKRATLWLYDIFTDYERFTDAMETLPFRSAKGTTGTQASFLHLLDGDHEKVKKLDKRVCEIMGFSQSVPVCGQTYTRQIDYYSTAPLIGLANSVHKMCTDVRLLASFGEIDEPFEAKQIGSSAMAYKRNPMRSERACALARYLSSMSAPISQTHAVQWQERTLDDSAIRRMTLPQSFMCADAILDITANVVDGMVVWPKKIERRLANELPFMATENILMSCVSEGGGDRAELHEVIREHSMEAAKRMKAEGVSDNDLMERIAGDARFSTVHSRLESFVDPQKFIGRAPQQVEEFVAELVDPVLMAPENRELLAKFDKAPSLSV